MKKWILLFLVCLCRLLTFGQLPFISDVSKQFGQYQRNLPQEKIFVHTDKSFYLAGETVWCKVYSVDASSHFPLPISSITYIELINQELKPVIQTKVQMDSGRGHGSFYLPGSLPSGSYLLRAYSNWMKNFSADFYFEEPIQVVNTLRAAAIVPPARSTETIQFFPEGGDQIVGYPGTIAFKATDGSGKGLSLRGVIMNGHHDTVTVFQTLHNGMGRFELNPKKGETYFALLRLNDSLQRIPMPAAKEKGFAITVTNGEAGVLLVSVKATDEFLNTPVFLFTQTRQSVINVQTEIVNRQSTQFKINKDDLGDGISTITLFNQSHQPVCERLVFKRPVEVFSVQVTSDQSGYRARRRVHIDLQANGKDQIPAAGNLSLSVLMLDSLQEVPEEDIVSYLYLQSDLKGAIESPAYYFKDINPASDQALDNLLLTQGWRRFEWKDILENRKPSFEFLPELEGPVVNGRITNKLTGRPVPGINAFLSIPANQLAFSSATSDQEGFLHFTTKNYDKSSFVVVQPAAMADSNDRIELGNSYSDKFSTAGWQQKEISTKHETALLNRSIANQVENTFVPERKRIYRPFAGDTSAFYGAPDRRYNLEEYTRFQTMEEVMREYVNDVRIRKDGNKYTFKVRNGLFGTYFEESPLMLLDGIPVADPSKIIALDPARVKSIDLILHNYYVGSSKFEGIVNTKSDSSLLGATQIDPAAVVVEFEGIQRQRAFYAPTYETAAAVASHLPDFRNILCWDPEIMLDANGKGTLSFFTSDLKGKFAVVVQGISKKGCPGKTVMEFEVTE